MEVRITTRHVDLSATFRELAAERTRKLTKYEPRLMAVDLLFDEDHGQLVTEARADVPGRPPLIAHTTAQDERHALDGTLRKLGRQLRRERSRRRDHQGPTPTVPLAD